ncbi:MAG: hypothetical protein JWP66_749 [Naasia sp.]|nr:hypothetical protein [Naasia sp.]
MKNVLWVVLGALLGFAAAKLLGRPDRDDQPVGSLDQRAREFGRTVAEAYRARESELRSAIGGAPAGTPQ